MKIPPKILKHHVKVSNEDAPAEAPLFTENPETPTEQVAAQDAATPDIAEQSSESPAQTKPVLKAKVIENIPKPSPVEKIAPIKPVPVGKIDSEEDIINVVSAEPQADNTEDVIKEVKKPAAKKMKRPARPVDSASNRTTTDGSSLARRIQSQTDLQRTPDSLPVLEAFQDFLDSEQRRMHKRIVALSVVFSVITLALISAGIAVAIYIVNPLRTEVTTFRTALSSLEENTSSVRQDNATIVSSLNKMIEHERAVNRDAASEIATQVTSYGDNLIEIKDLVSKLQSENAALKSQLGSINRDLPDVTYKVAAIMNEIDKMRAPVPPRSRVPVVQPAAKKAAPATKTVTEEPSVIADGASAKTFSAMISFVPQGAGKRAVCLLPIPE